MNRRERGFLLLGSHLGNPDRCPLTAAQLRTLAGRAQGAGIPDADRELEEKDLYALGYGREAARRIVALLDEEELLDDFLRGAARASCVPVTRVSAGYPLLLRKRLGLDSPGVLWLRGDASVLSEPAVALVGSRDLRENNRLFAAEVGRQAALQGYVLISGNARGADREAQESCLRAGGKVISIVADELRRQPQCKNMLYISEDGYSEAFSAQRALSRNRCIHALALRTFVAQTALGHGGTWDGAVHNLRNGWSPVYLYNDGSEGMRQLEALGAYPITREALLRIHTLPEPEPNLFNE